MGVKFTDPEKRDEYLRSLREPPTELPAVLHGGAAACCEAGHGSMRYQLWMIYVPGGRRATSRSWFTRDQAEAQIAGWLERADDGPWPQMYADVVLGPPRA